MTAGDKRIVADAEKDITELIASGSPTPEMLDTLAVAQLRLGKTEDAVQVLEQALTQSPGEFVSSLLLARTKLGQNDVKGAEAVLQKAVEASPKMVAAQLVLGRFYLSQKRVAEAEANDSARAEARAQEPNSPERTGCPAKPNRAKKRGRGEF